METHRTIAGAAILAGALTLGGCEINIDDLDDNDVVLVDVETRISAGSSKVYELDLRRGELLRGKVDANDDVDVYLIDTEEDYEDWAEGRPFHSLNVGSADDVEEFRFRLRAPHSGIYYFIVSNEHSILTPKRVNVYLYIDE